MNPKIHPQRIRVTQAGELLAYALGVAVCSSVLQCISSVLQCVAVCCIRDKGSRAACAYAFAHECLKGLLSRRCVIRSNTLQHTATHCNIRQHTATYGNTRQHNVIHCNTQQHTATIMLQHTATHCNTLQHIETHCNTSVCKGLFSTGCVFRSNTLKHTATICSMLQHTATHCNTLQHPAT